MPQTRTPDAHFYTEVRYKGAKSVVVSARLFRGGQVLRFVAASRSRAPTARWPWRWAMSSCASSIIERQAEYFEDYVPGATPTCRCWCGWSRRTAATCRTAWCEHPTSRPASARRTIRNGRLSPSTGADGEIVVPAGSVGFRWGEQGKWNLEAKEGKGKDTDLRLTLVMDENHDDVVAVGFPYFGNREHDHFKGTDHPSVLTRNGAGQDRGASPMAMRWSPPCSTCSSPIMASTAASAASTCRHELTRTTNPIRRPGPRRSPACRPRTDHHGGARVRPQCREDRRPVDGHPRRRR